MVLVPFRTSARISAPAGPAISLPASHRRSGKAAGGELTVASFQLPAPSEKLTAGNRKLETGNLFRIQLDDQLFLNRQVDLGACRQRRNAAGHLSGVECQPLRDAASLHFFHRM